MSANIIGKVNLPPLAQIGMVVRDIDKVMDFYTSTFGIGPWDVKYSGSESTVNGQIYKYKTKLAFANFGPITLELFEVTEGRSPVHSEFLDKGREGVHHFGFYVSEEEREQMIAELAKKGVKVCQEGQTKLGDSVVFLDAEKTGGVFLELIAKGKK